MPFQLSRVSLRVTKCTENFRIMMEVNNSAYPGCFEAVIMSENLTEQLKKKDFSMFQIRQRIIISKCSGIMASKKVY